MKEEKCPCCPNHCDVNSLSCGNGKKYFGKNIDENENHHLKKEESLMTLEEKTIYKMRRCGHFLHHSDKTINLEFLTNEEKETLVSILSKCLDNWE